MFTNLSVLDFAALTAAAARDEDVASARSALAAFLRDRFPGMLVSVGPGADLLLGPAAVILATLREAVSRALDAADLERALSLGRNPEDLLEALAARGVVPHRAEAATGEAAILVPEDTPEFVIDESVQLIATNGVEYRPSEVRMFVPPTATPQANQTAMTVVPGGWLGRVPVRAISPGANGNLPAGTPLVVQGSPVLESGAFLSVAASGGRDAETAAEVLARLPAVGAARTASTAAGVRAIVQSELPGAAVRVIGIGHPSLTRGISGLGIRFPGRMDVRVRVPGPLPTRILTIPATFVAPVGSVGEWQFTISAEDAPALAYVQRVWKAGSSPQPGQSYPFARLERGFDASRLPVGTDVRSGADAAFSVGATLTWRFLDTDTSNGGLVVGVSQQLYTVRVLTFAGVAAAQDALSGDAAPASGDALVRGPTPVAVSAVVTVRADPGVTVDPAAVRRAVADGINRSGIDQSLTAGHVMALTTLPTGVRFVSVTLGGTVYRADGRVVTLPGGQTVLDPGFDSSGGLGPDVTGFVGDEEDVTVIVV